MKNRKLFSALFLLMAGSCGMAQAGQATHISTAASNLSVSAAEEVTISITPQTGLQAGDIRVGTALATAHIQATSGSVIYRWTPGLATQTVNTAGNNIYTADLKASGDPSTILKVFLHRKNGEAEIVDTTDGSGSWLGGTERAADLEFITVSNSIAAGNYAMSLDAAIWTE